MPKEVVRAQLCALRTPGPATCWRNSTLFNLGYYAHGTRLPVVTCRSMGLMGILEKLNFPKDLSADGGQGQSTGGAQGGGREVKAERFLTPIPRSRFSWRGMERILLCSNSKIKHVCLLFPVPKRTKSGRTRRLRHSCRCQNSKLSGENMRLDVPLRRINSRTRTGHAMMAFLPLMRKRRKHGKKNVTERRYGRC